MSTFTYLALEPEVLTTRMRASTNANIIHMWNITKDCGRPSSLLKCHFFSCVSTFLGPLPLVIYFLIAPLTCCYLYSILYSPSPLSQLVPLSHSFLWSIFLTFFLNLLSVGIFYERRCALSCLCSQQFIQCKMTSFL